MVNRRNMCRRSTVRNRLFRFTRSQNPAGRGNFRHTRVQMQYNGPNKKMDFSTHVRCKTKRIIITSNVPQLILYVIEQQYLPPSILLTTIHTSHCLFFTPESRTNLVFMNVARSDREIRISVNLRVIL